MKKKLLTIALSAVMAISGALSAAAAATTVEGDWWTAWTEGYQLKQGTNEFSIDIKNGGNDVWNNVAAVFANVKTTGQSAPNEEVEGYKEYAVIRGDNWGWGGGDNKSVSGGDITYEGGVADAESAEDFVTTIKDCHIDAKITIAGNDITVVYDIKGTNGKTLKRTAKFSEDMSAGAYVFFVPDKSKVTVEQVEANPNQGGDEKPTEEKPADVPTGDTAPIAVFAVIAIAACAVVMVSKKKVNV